MNKQDIIEWLKFLAANDPTFACKVSYFKINLQHVIDALDDDKTVDHVIKEKEFNYSYDEGLHFREF